VAFDDRPMRDITCIYGHIIILIIIIIIIIIIQSFVIIIIIFIIIIIINHNINVKLESHFIRSTGSPGVEWNLVHHATLIFHSNAISNPTVFPSSHVSHLSSIAILSKGRQLSLHVLSTCSDSQHC